MHCSINIQTGQVWGSSMQGIYAQLMGGSICHGYMCIVLYIERSAIRCVKFGVVVFKASLSDWGGQLAMGIYALFYIYRSAKFGVVVFMASLLE